MLLLPATLTSREARVTLRMLQQALQSEGSETPVVVEAGSLQQLDSAALAVLLEIERLAVAWGRAFVVRTEIRGKGDPIQLDYRLEKAAPSWKIYDVNVLGVWLVENYRNSFAQEIGANGIDGLIAKMAERNKSAAAGGAKS